MTIIWSGLALGAIYALVAIGYNIVFLSQKTFNFAQAALMMLGAFIAYVGIVVWGLPWWLVAIAAAVIVGAIAALEERVAIRPVKDPHNLLVTTLGASIIMEGVAQVIWGGEPKRVPFFMGDQVLEFLGGRVYPVELALIVLVIVLVIALTQYAKRSMTGIALLGMSENREAAQLRGVNVRRFALMAFIFTGVLAGFLGVFVGPKTYAVATLGASLALKGFVVPRDRRLRVPRRRARGWTHRRPRRGARDAVHRCRLRGLTVFFILIVILMVKPTGLFTRRVERTV